MIGSLKLSQCKSLLDTDRAEFVPVSGIKYEDVTAYCPVYGQDMTVLWATIRHWKAVNCRAFKNRLTNAPFELSSNPDCVCLEFSLDLSQFEHLRQHHLGKTILYTDNHDWTDERIVASYRSQYHVEQAFNPHFAPIYIHTAIS